MTEGFKTKESQCHGKNPVGDDDADFRMILVTALKALQHEVVLAGDGIEAMRLLKTETVDVVMTDLVMPEKEGLETIMDIRRIHPQLGIIAMSGGGRGSAQDYLKVASKLGAKRVLAKPFGTGELVEALNAVLG